MRTALVGYGLKSQTQEDEQKELEAWEGPWKQPLQGDPWTSRTSTLSRKAVTKIACSYLENDLFDLSEADVDGKLLLLDADEFDSVVVDR